MGLSALYHALRSPCCIARWPSPAVQVVRFWSWFYKSDIIESLAEATGFSVFPRSVRQILRRELEADILCDGVPVFASALEYHFTLEGVGVSWLTAPQQLHSGIYSEVRDTHNYLPNIDTTPSPLHRPTVSNADTPISNADKPFPSTSPTQPRSTLAQTGPSPTQPRPRVNVTPPPCPRSDRSKLRAQEFH